MLQQIVDVLTEQLKNRHAGYRCFSASIRNGGRSVEVLTRPTMNADLDGWSTTCSCDVCEVDVGEFLVA